MEMITSKKGIYYTAVSLIIIALILSYANFDDNSRMKQRGLNAGKRAVIMNNFLDDIEKDTSRMMTISSYRTILSVEKLITDLQDFIDDFDGVFFDIFVDGVYNGTTYDIMADASILEWKDRVQEEADNLNLIFNIVPNSLDVYHVDYYDIRIELNLTILLSDLYGDTNWNYTEIFYVDISIAEFEDPLYKVKTYDKVTNLLIESPDSNFIDDVNNNTMILETHINKSYYLPAPNRGPSFLMRFEGNLSSSPYGIESFVNIEDLQKQDLLQFFPDADTSTLIDYIFFGNSPANTGDACYISLPTWFKIDDVHLNFYELDDIPADRIGC